MSLRLLAVVLRVVPLASPAAERNPFLQPALPALPAPGALGALALPAPALPAAPLAVGQLVAHQVQVDPVVPAAETLAAAKPAESLKAQMALIVMAATTVTTPMKMLAKLKLFKTT